MYYSVEETSNLATQTQSVQARSFQTTESYAGKAVAIASTLVANPLGRQSAVTYTLLGLSAIAAYAQFLHYSLGPLIR